MADSPVMIPIQLEVTDIDMNNIDLNEATKSMDSKLKDLTAQMNNVFGSIEPSKISKPMSAAMRGVETNVVKAVAAQSKLDAAMARSGANSEVYKSALLRLQMVQADLAEEKDYLKFTRGLGDKVGEAKSLGRIAEMLKEIKVLETEIGNGPKDFAMTGSEVDVQRVVVAYTQLVRALNDGSQAQAKFNQAVNDNKYTPDYKVQIAELDKLAKKIASLQDKSAMMSETGATDKAWARLNAQANVLEGKVISISEKMQDMAKSGTAFNFGGDAEEEMGRIQERVEEMLNSIASARGITSSTGRSMSKSLAVVKSACDRVKHAIHSIGKAFKKLSKISHSSSKDMTKHIKKLWKNFLMFGLGFRTGYYLVKKLRQVFIKEFQEMAKQIPEVNNELSSFMTATNQLKGSIASAFEPLAAVVIPVLVRFINVLVEASNAIARFFATLTGRGYFYKFTSNAIDAADSLSSGSKSAKELRRTLMGFDEINRLDKNTDSGSGSGAGDGANGVWSKTSIEDGVSELAQLMKEGWEKVDFTEVGEYIGIKLKNALTVATAYVEGPVKDMGEKIATLLGTFINGFVDVDGLAQSIGELVGAGINTAMSIYDKFLTTTNWIDVGKFIADALNAFIEKTDFSLIGKTLGDRFMAMINTAWSALTNFDYSNVGKKLAELINSVFATIGEADDNGKTGWQKIGEGLSAGVDGVINALLIAINDIDWSAVGTAIGEMLGSIDWGKVALDLTQLAGAILKALGTAIVSWGEENPVSLAIATLLGGIALGPGIASLFSKLLPDLSGLGGAITEELAPVAELFSRFVTFLAEKLPGAITKVITVVQSLATPILGVTTIIIGIVSAVASFISMLKDGFSWLGEVIMVVGIALVAIGAVVLGAPALVAGVVAAVVAVIATAIVLIKEHWTEICAFFKNLWQGTINWFKSAWNTVSTFFKNLWNSLTNMVKVAWNFIVGLIAGAIVSIVTVVKSGFNTIRTVISNIWNNVKNVCSVVWSFIKGLVIGTITNISSGISSVMNRIYNVWTSVWTKMKSILTGIWNGIVSVVKGCINGIIGLINGMLSAVASGINKIGSLVGKVSLNVPDWVPGLGGKKLGFNLGTITAPKIPYLAKGAVIPPNKEFMAVLGDQKNGTNVEAPLPVIQQAVAEVMNDNLDAMAAFAEAIVAAINDKDMAVVIGDREIGQAASRYNRRQSLARGV